MKQILLQQIKNKKWIIGMVHVDALPGTPGHGSPINKIIEKSVKEALKLQGAGVDAILIENMHDVPYLNQKVGPEIVACMTAISTEARKQIHLPIGIQILAGANKEALAVAQAARLNFIRAEGFTFAHVADEGYMESCAGELLRFRRMIGADDILIFTDVRKKHSSHSITADINIKEHVETASYFGSDGIIVTGSSTGKEAQIDDVKTAYQNTDLPVIIGSGITTMNIENYWNFADAFIVGSWFKFDGFWKNSISVDRVNEFMRKISFLRENR